MKPLLQTTVLLVLAAFVSFSVSAQTRGKSAPPVGHSQPGASGEPSAASGVERTSMDDILDKLNRNVDKKVKSICRGC